MVPAISSSRNHLFDDAGHYLLEDVPERIMLGFRDFLNRHPDLKGIGCKRN
jgi:hypothetical protein